MPQQRILLILESPGTGGTEVYVEGLARYLCDEYASEFSIEIAALSGTQEALEQRFPKTPSHAVSEPSGLNALPLDTFACANLHLYSNLLPTVRLLRKAAVPIVSTLHQPLAPWNAWHRWRWRMAAWQSDLCVGVSQACLQGYAPFLAASKTAVISGPLPLKTMPRKCDTDPERTPLIVSYAGRLSREKDLPILLEAVSQLPAMNAPEIQLLIIGDGAEQEALRAQSDALGLDVIFTGNIAHKALFERLLQSDIFVLPSRFEGLGLAAIEAMAIGVPTITADFPASAEYIRPDETGLIFKSGDSLALAKQIAALAQDQGKRRSLGQAGAEYVRHKFTAPRQYGRYAKLFARCSDPV